MSLVPWMAAARYSTNLGWINERINDISLVILYFEETLCPSSVWVRFSSSVLPQYYVYLYVSTNHIHTGKNVLFTYAASLLFSSPVKSWTQPCSLRQMWYIVGNHVWLKNEWKAVKRHSVRETSMSGWISAPHILIGHGGSQGPEQGWVYRWSSDKAMGLGTRKVSISSVFSGTTRHLNCAKLSRAEHLWVSDENILLAQRKWVC